MGTDEKRLAQRLKVDAFVKVLGENREYVFRTRDLSATGVFLYTRVGHTYPFSVGDTLELELYDYDTYVRCRVVIARFVEAGTDEAGDYPTGFGCHIQDIDPPNKSKLDLMLAHVAKAGVLY